MYESVISYLISNSRETQGYTSMFIEVGSAGSEESSQNSEQTCALHTDIDLARWAQRSTLLGWNAPLVECRIEHFHVIGMKGVCYLVSYQICFPSKVAWVESLADPASRGAKRAMPLKAPGSALNHQIIRSSALGDPLHSAGNLPLWFVLRGPGSSRGALVRSARPFFVLRGSHSSRRVLVCPTGPWSVSRRHYPFCGLWFIPRGPAMSHLPSLVLRGPDPSRMVLIRPWALICHAGPWSDLRGRFVLRGPDSSYGVLLRPAGPDLPCGLRDPYSFLGPWFIPLVLIRPEGPIRPSDPDSSSLGSGSSRVGHWSVSRALAPDSSRGAPTRPAGVLICPDLTRPAGALKPDRESTSVWGPSGFVGLAIARGGGGERFAPRLPPMICLSGVMARMRFHDIFCPDKFSSDVFW